MSRLAALLSATAAAALLCSDASARMGETLEQCKARYGEPGYREPGKADNTFEWKVGGRAFMSDGPFKPIHYIDIHFVDGKAAQIGLLFYLSEKTEKYGRGTSVKYKWPANDPKVPELLAKWAHPGKWTLKPGRDRFGVSTAEWFSQDGRYIAHAGEFFYQETGQAPTTQISYMTISSVDKFEQSKNEALASRKAKWNAESEAHERHLSGLRRTTDVRSALMEKNKTNVKSYFGRAPDKLIGDDGWTYKQQFFDSDSEKVVTSVHIGFFQGKVWHVAFYSD